MMTAAWRWLARVRFSPIDAGFWSIGAFLLTAMWVQPIANDHFWVSISIPLAAYVLTAWVTLSRLQKPPPQTVERR